MCKNSKKNIAKMCNLRQNGLSDKYRKALEELKEWKSSPARKPLILKGARQVGKTWLMKEFGKEYYKKTFYFSFDREESIHDIFKLNKDPYRIIESLGIIRNDKILPLENLSVDSSCCLFLENFVNQRGLSFALTSKG